MRAGGVGLNLQAADTVIKYITGQFPECLQDLQCLSSC